MTSPVSTRPSISTAVCETNSGRIVPLGSRMLSSSESRFLRSALVRSGPIFSPSPCSVWQTPQCLMNSLCPLSRSPGPSFSTRPSTGTYDIFSPGVAARIFPQRASIACASGVVVVRQHLPNLIDRHVLGVDLPSATACTSACAQHRDCRQRHDAGCSAGDSVPYRRSTRSPSAASS